MRLTYWTGFWVFLLDQLSKYAIVHRMNLVEVGRIPIWSPYLEFRMAWNRGVNFGLFSDFDMRWVLIVVAIAISIGALYWIRKEGGSKWTYLSGGLLVGGAVGNIVDRLLYGAVADFINMSCCGIENPYAFNVADIGIFVGAFGLIVFTSDKGGKASRKTGNKST